MPSKLQCVDEIGHEPVVGRYYLVPCVKRIDPGCHFSDTWHPVLLPLHSDPEFKPNASMPHWHYDRRFTVTEYGDDEEWSNHRNAKVVLQTEGCDEYPAVYGALEYLRKRCLRVMPEWPLVPAFTSQVEAVCKDKRLNLGCMKCPHRGTDLRHLPPRPDGTVMCPSHGLVWSLATGELVSRLPKAEPHPCL